jgi:hypothetical protein
VGSWCVTKGIRLAKRKDPRALLFAQRRINATVRTRCFLSFSEGSTVHHSSFPNLAQLIIFDWIHNRDLPLGWFTNWAEGLTVLMMTLDIRFHVYTKYGTCSVADSLEEYNITREGYLNSLNNKLDDLNTADDVTGVIVRAWVCRTDGEGRVEVLLEGLALTDSTKDRLEQAVQMYKQHTG